MTPFTRLILIRHGEVEETYQRVFGGRIDMALSARGATQAQAVAEYLRAVHLDAVYVSPMRRARLTVAPLLALNGYRAMAAPELREVDFGVWTGLRWDEVRERFGTSAFEWLDHLEQDAIPEAEPRAAFEGRVRAVLDRIFAAHRPGAVAVVCHGGVIRMALSILLRLPLPRTAGFEIDYASLTVADCRPDRAEVQLLNYTPWRRLP